MAAAIQSADGRAYERNEDHYGCRDDPLPTPIKTGTPILRTGFNAGRNEFSTTRALHRRRDPLAVFSREPFEELRHSFSERGLGIVIQELSSF